MKKNDTSFEIKITIPGIPIPKKRPRKGKWGKFFTPKKTSNYERMVKYYALEAMRHYEILKDCPVFLTITYFLPIPESWSNKKKALAESGNILPITKPDIDNLEKSIFDGLSGIAFEDDKQVIECLHRKIYSTNPRVEILIRNFATIIS